MQMEVYLPSSSHQSLGLSSSNQMSFPCCVFRCRPNSHPFQERCIPLNEPVKVGRAVARLKALPNNAIFDCKVLSRQHAKLWYESGKVCQILDLLKLQSAYIFDVAWYIDRILSNENASTDKNDDRLGSIYCKTKTFTECPMMLVQWIDSYQETARSDTPLLYSYFQHK